MVARRRPQSARRADRGRVPARGPGAAARAAALGRARGGRGRDRGRLPLLTTLALQTSTTSHAAVVVGLLPLTTAALSALRTGRRPSRAFWAAALAGAGVVVAFTVQQSGGALSTGDLYLFGALLICAAGYTEGGRPRPGDAGLAGDRLGADPHAAAGRPRLGGRARRRTGPSERARRPRSAVGGRRVAVLRAVRLVPGHGRHRRAPGQSAPAGAAAAHPGLGGPAARRAPLPPPRWPRRGCWSASP